MSGNRLQFCKKKERVFKSSDAYTSTINRSKDFWNGVIEYSWEEEIIIIEEYKRFLGPSSILLLEVMDCDPSAFKLRFRSSDNIIVSRSCRDNARPVAWAFLKPFSRSGHFNVGLREKKGDESNDDSKKNIRRTKRKCKLQLYRYQNDTWLVRERAKQLGLFIPDRVPQVFLQYLRKNKYPLDSSIAISVSPTNFQNKDCGQSSQGQIKCDGEGKEKPIGEYLDEITTNTSVNHMKDYGRKTRMSQEACLIPDVLLHRLDIGGMGASSLAFSNSGNFLAVASAKYMASLGYPLMIFDTNTGKRINSFMQMHHDTIVDLEWSILDTFLGSASVDGTIKIHKILKEALISGMSMVRMRA